MSRQINCGVHAAADNAGSFIYLVVLAIKHKLTVADLVNTLAPYLPLAEGLQLAAQSTHWKGLWKRRQPRTAQAVADYARL